METVINADSDLSYFRALLKQTTFNDFSGDTEFNQLSPDLKVKWLDEATRFIADTIAIER